MVGLALRGNLEVETIVAQGCRPIGAPMFVTRHEHQVIFELDGRPAVEVLQELFDELAPSERAKARHSLFMGVVMDPLQGAHDHVHGLGDFLIRNLVGVDPHSGAIGVAARLHRNAVVQFHLRDADTSTAELRALLAEHAAAHPAPSAALMFSCLGRGQGLYGEADHDSALIRSTLGADLPLAGFFCNGEIGPVGGRTYMHGYTSAIMLLRSAAMI